MWLSEPVFSHGQLNVAASRVGSRERIRFAIKPLEEGSDNLTNNVVFKEVLLDSGLDANKNHEDFYDPTTQFDDEDYSYDPTTHFDDEGDSVAADLPIYTPSDIDYEGPFDELLSEADEEEETLFKKPLPVKKFGKKYKISASPPKNMAPVEETVPRQRQMVSAAHENWVASLPDPPMMELTDEEKERQAMLKRRAQYFKNMYDSM